MLPTLTPPDPMGATLAKLALDRAREHGLEHAPTRALLHMALTALDKANKKGDPPNLYFGGRIALARALGYGRTDPDEADTQAAHRAVERAMAMIAAHQLVIVTPGRSTARTEYDLSPLRDQVHGERGCEAHGERVAKLHEQRGPKAHAQRVAIRGTTSGTDKEPLNRSRSPQAGREAA